MSEPPLFSPRLAGEGEPCASCGALLAADQRYCLSCGERRAAARVPFPQPVAPPRAAAAVPPPPRRTSLPLSALAGMAGAAALGLGLLAGALIVRANESPAATQAPAVATVAATTVAPAPAATVVASFSSDWPAGQKGWTVRLQSLPKDATAPAAVAEAKALATAKGAPAVGALDSDAFASLDPGSYVVYSGIASSQSAAQDALAGLSANFPDAEVVEVSEQASTSSDGRVTKSKDELEQQEKTTTPEEAQKNTRKAPPTVESEGTPPPADGGEAGAGSDATEIG